MAKVTLKGSPVSLKGELPRKGEQAPELKAVRTDLSEISLEDYKGKRVVLNIFPSVDTGVCARSVRQFNEEASKLDNTVVLCLSKDLPFALGRFCAAEGLENVIPASLFRNCCFAEKYGAVLADSPMAGLCARCVIVIDEAGKVIYTELVPEITQEPNYEEAVKALK